MNGIAVKPATDVNPDLQCLPASSGGAGPPRESPSLPAPVHLTNRVSMDMRGLALALVTTVVAVFALQWAERFFIPLLLGIIIAYTLNPLVVWLERMKIPRVVGTSTVMLVVLCGGAVMTLSLRGQIQTILEQLPAAASKLSIALRSMREGQPNTMQKVQAAARELDTATSQAGDIHSDPKPPATHIIIDQPTFKLGDVLMAGSMSMVGFLSQSVMVVWGLLLAIPILGMVKVISQHREDLHPVEELLKK